MAVRNSEIVKFSLQGSDWVKHLQLLVIILMLKQYFWTYRIYFIIILFNYFYQQRGLILANKLVFIALSQIFGRGSMQVKKNLTTSSSDYWCHLCQITFCSELMPGKDIILCPQCSNDFCQIKTRFSRPQKFKPYQKAPYKIQKNTKRIDKHALRMTVNQLAQIMQIRQSEKFELTEQMLGRLRIVMGKNSECSVCRLDLQPGEQGLVPRCNHSFHEQCLVEWIKRKNSCPTCRQEIIEGLTDQI